ncbi:energy-coupling factor transporter transmembrane component T family protein [Actinomyces sp. zg-332]|uniref:energy-coupling factor transporter transmembrane component T family protein n=1 Tax=Actinomyces sp. zg-332 TaxID=2708340 RepID=UPI001E36B1A1|nr:energy-coupling factor transporter transmembrane component T [Actinomyces sp. zg-332]
MKTTTLLGYIERESFMHSLTGATKFIIMILASIAAMLGFDTRFLALMAVISVIIWKASKLKLSDLYIILCFLLFFMATNNLLIFLFAPEYGVEIYGTKHLLFDLPWRYSVTLEQLFYQLNVTLKYFTVIPIALIFIATTSPSQFASSLNKIGISYKVAYSISLALRYIPDVQREFRTISHAQQARGIDTSRDVKISTRVKNVSSILIPLVLSTFARIETVAASMELRGFGQGKKRSWYVQQSFRTRDYIVIIVALCLLALAITLVYVNGGRFYNPFK